MRFDRLVVLPIIQGTIGEGRTVTQDRIGSFLSHDTFFREHCDHHVQLRGVEKLDLLQFLERLGVFESCELLPYKTPAESGMEEFVFR